jgi:hypothetical protein
MDLMPDGKFVGFSTPDDGYSYTQLPNELFAVLDRITSMTELKIILYVLRHTWGFQEHEKQKKLTIDEFMHGRKLKDGTRMDSGTGLSDYGVKDGIAKALEHEFINCEIDDRDKGRIKKYYGIKTYKGPYNDES